MSQGDPWELSTTTLQGKDLPLPPLSLSGAAGHSARRPQPICLHFRSPLHSAVQSLSRVQGRQVPRPPPGSRCPTALLCLTGAGPGHGLPEAEWGRAGVGVDDAGPFLAPAPPHLLSPLERSLSDLGSWLLDSSSVLPNASLAPEPQKPSVCYLCYLCSAVAQKCSSLAAWAGTRAQG